MKALQAGLSNYSLVAGRLVVIMHITRLLLVASGLLSTTFALPAPPGYIALPEIEPFQIQIEKKIDSESATVTVSPGSQHVPHGALFDVFLDDDDCVAYIPGPKRNLAAEVKFLGPKTPFGRIKIKKGRFWRYYSVGTRYPHGDLKVNTVKTSTRRLFQEGSRSVGRLFTSHELSNAFHCQVQDSWHDYYYGSQRISHSLILIFQFFVTISCTVLRWAQVYGSGS
jgi:hypothetical protein